MMGMGFLAAVAGSVIAGGLAMRMRDRLLESGAVASTLVEAVLAGFWVMVVLPGLVWVCCRYLELRPLATALTGAITGQIFLFGIPLASQGFDAVVEDSRRLAIQLGTLVVGIALSAWAGREGRASADRAQQKALEQAKARKSEYDEFLKQSAAFADKRDAQPIAAAGPTDAPPAAPPVPAPDGSGPAPGGGEGTPKA